MSVEVINYSSIRSISNYIPLFLRGCSTDQWLTSPESLLKTKALRFYPRALSHSLPFSKSPKKWFFTLVFVKNILTPYQVWVKINAILCQASGQDRKKWSCHRWGQEKLHREQWLSKLNVHKNHLESFLKHKLLGPNLRISDLGLGGA